MQRVNAIQIIRYDYKLENQTVKKLIRFCFEIIIIMIIIFNFKQNIIMKVKALYFKCR